MKVLMQAYELEPGKEVAVIGRVLRHLPTHNAVEVQLVGKEPTDTVIVMVDDCWIDVPQTPAD